MMMEARGSALRRAILTVSGPVNNWMVRSPVASNHTGRGWAGLMLLEETAMSVADIAHADGFGFSAAFKRVRGLNPREFRRTAHETD